MLMQKVHSTSKILHSSQISSAAHLRQDLSVIFGSEFQEIASLAIHTIVLKMESIDLECVQ